MTQILPLDITAWPVIRSRPSLATSLFLMRHASAICR